MDSYTATSKDFDKSAQSKANQFWFFSVLAALIGYYLHWWAVIPGAIALLSMIQSCHATKLADQLRKGTYRIPNLNNGAPDGNAANSEK